MHRDPHIDDENSKQLAAADFSTLAALNRAEIDQQITTAKAYPRSLKRFMNEALDMVTLTEQIAESCIYALPRKERGQTKMIEGPSARFAEMVAHAWGNCRAGARVVSEDREFITAQGVFHDLEKNVVITYEVKRRITTSTGQRYSTDMVAVTGNAASSIALRNAVLKGVPKSFWQTLYDEARRTAVGDAKTLATKRSDMLAYFMKLGVTEDMILSKLGLHGVEDIGLDELAALKGMATAIKEGEVTADALFAPDDPPPSAATGGMAGLKSRVGAQPQGEPAPAAAAPAAQAGAPLIDPVALLKRVESAKDGAELEEIEDSARGLGASDKRRIREACEARRAQLKAE